MPSRLDNSRVWPEKPASEKYAMAPSMIWRSRSAEASLSLGGAEAGAGAATAGRGGAARFFAFTAPPMLVGLDVVVGHQLGVLGGLGSQEGAELVLRTGTREH